MNAEHAVAFMSGNAVALTFRKDRVEFGPTGALHVLYENQRIKFKKSTIPISKWWMLRPERRTYKDGVVFRPGMEAPKNSFNLWRGFSVEPSIVGGCDLFLKHLFDNVCGRKRGDYTYLLGWMAHMVQRPWEKPGVAVVLRGEKGVGKDVVPVHLSKLFRAHYVKISQMDQLTGKFNAHMSQALLIHVEEGLWAGDKKSEGPLKSLITSETMAIERKGIDVIQIENCSRVLITSNERWVVPATRGERRFAVYNVGKKHMQDRPYFAAMANQMEAGGYGVLLHFLKQLDITGFDVGAAPDTEGLADQKTATHQNVERFWDDLWEARKLPGFSEEEWAAGEVAVSQKALFDVYLDWMKAHRYQGELASVADFNKRIMDCLPGIRIGRPWGDGIERPRCFMIPPRVDPSLD